MRKSFTAVVLVVGMALGSVLTLALNPVGAANALAGTSTSSSHQNILQQALSTLVGNGTITQKQSDAISSQVGADRAAFWAKRPPIGRQDLAKVAFLLGLDAKTLRTDLGSGQTIAQVASAKGINPTTLANQIVALLEKGIDARVSAHHLTKTNAASMKSDLAARVNAFLNRTWGHKHGVHHASGSTPTTVAPSTSSPTTTGGGSSSTSSSTSTTKAPASTSSSTSTTAKH